MQALHAAASSQFIMSPHGTHIHVVNQISHGKGATIHSYNNSASSGFNSGKNAGQGGGYINNLVALSWDVEVMKTGNNSFNSAQQPT